MTLKYLEAAERLHRYLELEHWNGSTLTGPDPGIRWNTRVGRFIKSYLPSVSWSDDLVYIQAQGYWIMDNWLLSDLSGDERYRNLAVDATRGVLGLQLSEGYWRYPNPEWEGRIATVEGCFGALGLLDTYQRTGDAEFLEAALAWYEYMKLGIGFRGQPDSGMLAVNYFAHSDGDGGGVPNNSTLVLWLLARLFEATQDREYLELAEPLARWLTHVQLESGELPYRLHPTPGSAQNHFLCHQYNAFEFMDLVHYQRITGDESVLPMMARLAGFLETGFTQDGFAKYDCSNDRVEVLYYSTALAQALQQAKALGFGDSSDAVARAYARVLGQQRSDGGFVFHSRANYRYLRDRRSYPRYLAMILNHLLLAQRAETGADDRT